MFGHLFDDLVGHGGDVRTGQGAVGHMDGIAHAGRDDLAVDVRVVGEDRRDALDQVNARLADVIQTPQERAYIGGARPGRQQCLVGREDQGAVGGDALGRQHLDGLQALHGHGNFYNHVGGIQCVDGAAFLDHAGRIGGGGLYLAGDGAVHDGGNLFQGLGVVPALLSDQAGVGGDTRDHAHIVGGADFIHIGSINEKTQFQVPPYPLNFELSQANS